jgi:hypothetical protein
MSEEERIYEILSTIRKIEESKQPVSVYFNQNSVPFSLAQYYRYRRILKKCGEDGLRDGRKDERNTNAKNPVGARFSRLYPFLLTL